MPNNFIIGISVHRQKVRSLVLDHKKAYRLCFSTSNTLRNKSGNRTHLAHLNKIIEVGDGFVDVEPRVTMRQLVDTLFPLIPPVVPEFSGITVGGAVMGAALESSSWKYGQFNDCCLEYDILLGNGELITISKEQHPDLFFGISGSYGTLGTLTRIRLRLIKAKRSVHLEMVEGDPLKIFQNPPKCDFLDAVRFHDKSVTMIGKFVDQPATNFLLPHSPWFYQQIKVGEMVLPTIDYLFRFDRGAFWMGRYLLSKKMLWHALLRNSPKETVAKIGRDPKFLFRAFLGWACGSQWLYRALHTIPEEMIQESFFIHDFYTPPDKMEIFLKKNKIFPIWLCPVKGTRQPQFLAPHFGRDFWVNVGLYGPYQKDLDVYNSSLGGRKMLYSGTTLERAEFEKIYFEKEHQTLRTKFSAEKKFPHLYDKVKWNRKSTPRKTTTSATT